MKVTTKHGKEVLACLIPKDENDITCHEKTLCDCEVIKLIEDLEVERDKLKYVSGKFRCAKCGLVLYSRTINMSDGGVYNNNEPTICSNNCGPMWRISVKDELAEVGKRLDGMALEVIKYKEKLQSIEEISRRRFGQIDLLEAESTLCHLEMFFAQYKVGQIISCKINSMCRLYFTSKRKREEKRK